MGGGGKDGGEGTGVSERPKSLAAPGIRQVAYTCMLPLHAQLSIIASNMPELCPNKAI
jgi:hypothetical protein